MHTVRLHRDAVNRNMDVKYHEKCLQEIVDGTYDFGYQFIIETGKKYHKVVMIAHNTKSVHCFIDKNNGNVFKSASWRSPAKGIRFNLLDKQSREELYRRAAWSGSHLYLR